MRLEILGWRSSGLRCLDLDIDLIGDDSSPPKVTLLQMPNGSGKTTTLRLMRAALTGEARNWSEGEVRRFQPREGGDQGEFQIRLRAENHRATLILQLDFEAGAARYSTTFDRGLVEKYSPPPFLRRFLNPHFVNLLVFDGELPQALLEPQETKASEAIDAFFQLYLLTDVQESIEEIWEEKAAQVSATHPKGLVRRRNKLKEVRRKRDELSKARAEAIERIALYEQEIQDLEATVNRGLQATQYKREELNEYERRLETQRQVVQRLLDEAMTALRAPHRLSEAFRTELVSLRESFDRLKLPESTSRQFFEELATESQCVCGRSLGEEERKYLRNQASQYLGSETAGVLNRLKVDITNYGEATLGTDLDTLLQQIRDAIHERDRVKSHFHLLRKQLIDQGDEEIKSAEAALEAKRKDRGELEDLISRIDGAGRPEESLDYWELEFDRREKEYAEITRTLRLRATKKCLNSILQRSYSLARDRIRASLVEAVNRRTDQLLEGHEIHVKDIDHFLQLDKQTGASQGQTLAVGYAFLSTLLAKGRHDFPFVVDAPVLALDTRVSSQVGGVLPRVCGQFIGFVLDRERSGFVDALDRSADGRVKYLTAFRRNASNQYLLDQMPSEGSVVSENSAMVVGRPFFDKVHFKEREDNG